jgi:hypothetical protein
MNEDTCKTKEQLVILIILTGLVVVVVVKVRKRECKRGSHSHIWFCHVVTQLKNNNRK